MRVLIVGVGALGTVYACLLKKNGHEVYGLDREPVADYIRENGVKITGIWGDYAECLTGIASNSESFKDKQFDLIIITVKSFHTESAIKEIARLFSENTYVCLLQNGFGNYESAIKYIPREKVILGRVIFGAETLGIGVSKVTVIADDVIIGSPENIIPFNIIEKFALLFNNASIPTRPSKKVLEYVWAKIIYNSALNSLGALFEVNYGKLAENVYTRKLMNSIIREIFSLLSAMGQKTLWSDAESYIETFYQALVPSTAAHHASMLQDISNGRKTEIDALNGAVVKLAKKYNIQVPVNEIVVEMVKAKELFAMQRFAK